MDAQAVHAGGRETWEKCPQLRAPAFEINAAPGAFFTVVDFDLHGFCSKL